MHGVPDTAAAFVVHTGRSFPLPALVLFSSSTLLRFQDDSTALQAACEGGHTEIAKTLLQHGADVNAKDMVRN